MADRLGHRKWLVPTALTAAAVGLAIGYLLLWPIPIAPQSWNPTPSIDLPPGLANDRRLARPEVLFAGASPGPEALVANPDGRMYSGLSDGRIVRFYPNRPGQGLETIARTGGRPYGVRPQADGSVLVADGELGLLRVDAEGGVEVLLNQLNGEPFNFADDLIVTSDGRIWFTVASTRFGPDRLAEEFSELSPNGLLAWFDPATGRADVALRDLRFANGLALGPDGLSLLVSETAGFRITRYWFAGPKKGRAEPFIDGLPGWPDNIARDPVRSVYWVAFPNMRGPEIDSWAGSGWLRAVDWRLRALPGWPQRNEPPARGLVLAIDQQGQIVDALGSLPGEAGGTTSATPFGDRLYLGSGQRNGIRSIPLGPRP